VKKENILKRNEKTGSGSEKIWDYMKLLIEKNVEKGAVLQ
jgi:putative hydrolase of HD superfamily